MMPRPTNLVLATIVFQAAVSGQVPSSTAFGSSPNPSLYGQPVTLVATVTPGATGKVTFYDGTALLGVGTLSGTQASLTTVLLPSGNRQLRAHYRGDGIYAASNSASSTQTVVAGGSLGLRHLASFPNAMDVEAIAVGDFNGDGKQDVVMVNETNRSVSVYLGNGDGSFQNGVSYPVGTPSSEWNWVAPVSVAVGDFNDDGRMDLAVANLSGGNVSILLGNGDGTFQSAVNYAPGNGPHEIAVADFNGDGVADLVVANTVGKGLAILLGNGDGSFQDATFASPDEPCESVAVADFNGDGTADLVVGLRTRGGVLLGNGDGTFQPVRTVSSTLGVYSVADFNGDGKADLLVNSDQEVLVLLGYGDATFSAPLSYRVNYAGQKAMIADFNGDGKIDLAFPDYLYSGSYANVAVALGNGDGTFGAAIPYAEGASLGVGVVGDFNGDGKADLVTAAAYPATYAVLLGTFAFTCNITPDGAPSIDNLQLIINEALGTMPAVDDLNHDNMVNVADVQIVIEAVLGSGCLY